MTSRVRCDENGQYELDVEESFLDCPPPQHEYPVHEIRIGVSDRVEFGEKLG